jgi:predicted amidohydrolase
MSAGGKPSTNKPVTFKAAMIQMRSGLLPAVNLDAAVRMIGEAKSAGAEYVLTPEMTNILAANREQLFSVIVEEDADTSLATLRELARKLAITVHIGSLAIKLSHDRAANRSFLISPKGDIAARYDKIHMFDVDLANGESYRESRNYRPGELAVLSDLPWGRLGLTVCYDLRFPALYRALAEAGATMLAIPSAFTRQTGEAHWDVLIRARAIENGSFVFAAVQGGKHENGRETFGHSLIVDPWGRVLAEGGTEPGVVMAEIDLAEVAHARARIPSLQHGRRFEIVEPMAEPTHLHVVRGTE